MKSVLLGCVSALALAGEACAATPAQKEIILAPPASNFSLCSPASPDGCALLASQNAAAQGLLQPAQPGLYTWASVNGGASPTGFWNYARQSGQLPYKNAQGRRSAHPAASTLAGVDTGIGPWTPTASLLNPTTYNWSANLPMCSYSATSHYVRCNLTGTYAPSALKGYISNGTLTVTSGTAPTVGQYVYYGVANPTAPDVVLAPYLVTGGSGSTFTLAGNPPNVGSSGSPIDLNASTLLTIAGFNLDDVYLFGTGSGLVDFHNNRFTAGSNLCQGGGGVYGENISSMTNTFSWTYSNYFGEDPTCSHVAMLYPKIGAQQSSFTGTSTQNLNFSISATIAAQSTSLSVTSTSSPLGIGTQVNFTGTGCAASEYIKSDGTATGGAGTYTLGAAPGGAGTTCTPTTASNFTLTATGVTGTMALGQYATGPAAWTNPAQYQLVDFNSGVYFLSPSNGGPPAVSNAAMTTGPIQATWGFDIGSPNTGAGSTIIRWNYSDKLGTLAGVGNGGSLDCSFNYVEVRGEPGFHIDPCVAQLVQTSLPQGSTLTIPYHHQNFNVSLTDAYTVGGVTYGGYSGTLASGGGTAGLVWFSTYLNNSTGYYVYTQDVQIEGNLLFSNLTANNINNSKVKSNGYSIYLDTQGSSNPGPYPGSAGTIEIFGNGMDSVGANGCIFTSPYIYTTPGGSTPIVPNAQGNFSLNTGGAITNSVCQ